jgi:hypothetical protein
MQDYIRQYEALSDEQLLEIYQRHQFLKTGAFADLMTELTRRDLYNRLFPLEPEHVAEKRPRRGAPAAVQPRAHHYTFTHRVLRDKVFQEPLEFFNRLRLSSAQEYLTFFWNLTGASLQEDQEDSFIDPVGFCVASPEKNGDLHWVTVTLPRPQFITEAYFVSIVFNEEATLRWYFTLEFTETDEGCPLLPLACEWEREKHINWGLHILPTKEDFNALVRRVMQGRN